MPGLFEVLTILSKLMSLMRSPNQCNALILTLTGSAKFIYFLATAVVYSLALVLWLMRHGPSLYLTKNKMAF
jgi:hypothetical protein